MGKIRKVKYGDKEFEYDEDSPCIICGEPVIGASMGGTAICPACDCGKCRYCGMTIMIFKEEIDNGESKKGLLEHMQWHHKNTPDVVDRKNNAHRRILDKIEANKLQLQ